MMIIKQVSLALVALGLSASAYAAHPVDEMLPAAPPVVCVTIPQQIGSWAIGVEALYQATANGDFNYATTAGSVTTVAPTVILTEIDTKTHAVKPNSGWGWEVDVAYLFPGNGNDVELSWKHLNTSESKRIFQNGNFVFGPSVFTPVVFGFDGGWDEAQGKTTNDYNHVDLVFGQKMDFAQKVTLRAFGGLRYASIDQKDRGNYFAFEDDGAGGVDTVDLFTRAKSDFQGIGPRAGMDAKVRLGGNFSLVGTFGGSLLVGQRDQKANFDLVLFDDSLNVLTEVDINSKIRNETRVVPELDARLGLNFAWAFNPDAALEVELGYEAINYFDVKNTSAVSYVDTISHDNDFGIYGPYLRLQLNLA